MQTGNVKTTPLHESRTYAPPPIIPLDGPGYHIYNHVYNLFPTTVGNADIIAINIAAYLSSYHWQI